MPNSNNINSLEEALRILWLGDAQDADSNISEEKLQLLFSSLGDAPEMNKAKRDELVNKLFDTVQSSSLGELVTEAMETKGIKQQALAKSTKVPVYILKGLKADAIFPNNIPVLLIEKLLNILEISFQKAETAIIKTFEIMKRNEYLNPSVNPGVSFRRNQDNKHDFSFLRNSTSRTDGRELYENRESLQKYLSQLRELMDTERKS